MLILEKQTHKNVYKGLALLAVAVLMAMLFLKPAYAANGKQGLSEEVRLALIVDAFNATNTQRQLNGLPPLTWSQDLFNAAEVRSLETTALFSHSRPDGSDCFSVAPGIMYGENILRGNTNRVKSGAGAIDGWMGSPGHRANILNPSHTTGALSLRCVNGTYYWVQVFGR